ncbi:MAG: hydrolase 1, exosortase A system-associated [Halioglobus sp.]|nr:hydrolase 1, exosortase A system-associated [Halioglobus sp.]
MNDTAWRERALVFPCGDNRLVGIVAEPAHSPGAGTGVVILVGGPQYRVGSHRQFTLLARDLAAAGFPSLRFDYSGMGDSEGDQREFSETSEDLSAAITAFQAAVPGVARLVLWGLCDAASSAMMFAHQHAQVSGLVLLNPWVHGVEYSPEVKLSHYYRPLIRTGENWSRLFKGKIDVLPAMKEFLDSSLRWVAGWFGMSGGAPSRHSFVQQMLDGLSRFKRPSLVILSEDDLTAREFSSLVARDAKWAALLDTPQVSRRTVAGADHTFSRRVWSREVSRLTIDWIRRNA